VNHAPARRIVRSDGIARNEGRRYSGIRDLVNDPGVLRSGRRPIGLADGAVGALSAADGDITTLSGDVRSV
jgi:hypothetical protein